MSNSMENAKHQASRLQVFAVVAFYMVAALIMVIANKWVLNASSLPLTFLFAQLVLAVLLIRVCVLFRLLVLPPFDVQLCKTISGVIVVNVVGLVFNTLCLKLVDASYFQVARGLVLPLTVLLASVLLKTMPPRSTLVAVGLVCAGFFYGITPSAASPTNERTNTKLGIIYGVLSAGMIAVHAILVKWSMRHVSVKDMDASYVTNIAYLTNLLSALGLFPILILTGEVARWPALIANEDGTLGTFLIGSLITGTFGFFICMAALLSITVTSPVTHMFSAAVRSVLQTFLGIAIFGDVLTVPRAISLGLIIAGSATYAYYKAITPFPTGGKGGPQGGKSAEEGRAGGDEGESMPMLEKEFDADDEEMDRLEREHEVDLAKRQAREAEAATSSSLAAAADVSTSTSSSEPTAPAAAAPEQTAEEKRANRAKVERHTQAAFGEGSDDDDDAGDMDLDELERELLAEDKAKAERAKAAKGKRD